MSPTSLKSCLHPQVDDMAGYLKQCPQQIIGNHKPNRQLEGVQARVPEKLILPCS